MKWIRGVYRWFGECIQALVEDDDPFIRDAGEWDEKQRRHLSFLGSGSTQRPPQS